MRLINSSEIRELLPMDEAVVLMRRAFRVISAGTAAMAERQALQLPGGTGLLMGAADSEAGIAGKLVGVMPGNSERGLPGSVGLVALLDPETAEPLALIDGTSLTAWRTAAANACAIDQLARADVTTALLVGCGTQAETQLQGMVCVRELKEIRVLDLREDKVRTFIDRQSVTPSLLPATEPASALEGVDLVVAATTSKVPVIPGDRVPAGTHVSGIGSFRPDMREFDRDLLERASIFIESRESVLHEAGELIDFAEAGRSGPEDWTEMGEVLSGEKPGRTDAGQITFFKSVGHAVFDLVAARAIYDAAVEQDAGVVWKP